MLLVRRSAQPDHASATLAVIDLRLWTIWFFALWVLLGSTLGHVERGLVAAWLASLLLTVEQHRGTEHALLRWFWLPLFVRYRRELVSTRHILIEDDVLRFSFLLGGVNVKTPHAGQLGAWLRQQRSRLSSVDFNAPR